MIEVDHLLARTNAWQQQPVIVVAAFLMLGHILCGAGVQLVGSEENNDNIEWFPRGVCTASVVQCSADQTHRCWNIAKSTVLPETTSLSVSYFCR